MYITTCSIKLINISFTAGQKRRQKKPGSKPQLFEDTSMQPPPQHYGYGSPPPVQGTFVFVVTIYVFVIYFRTFDIGTTAKTIITSVDHQTLHG